MMQRAPLQGKAHPDQRPPWRLFGHTLAHQRGMRVELQTQLASCKTKTVCAHTCHSCHGGARQEQPFTHAQPQSSESAWRVVRALMTIS